LTSNLGLLVQPIGAILGSKWNDSFAYLIKMTPKLITFDCAQTLLWTDWQPHTFIVRCCALAQVPVPVGAETLYLELFRSRIAEYWASNLYKSTGHWREFWERLGQDWLSAMSLDPLLYETISLVAEKELFTTDSHTFELYSDVVPCLESLKQQGIRLSVISNWDHSLHGCLEAFGIADYFEAIYASLEHGVEKPDPELFQIALRELGVAASDTLHVGDDPRDDLQGARSAGIRALQIDRNQPSNSFPIIHTLENLESTFEWNL